MQPRGLTPFADHLVENYGTQQQHQVPDQQGAAPSDDWQAYRLAAQQDALRDLLQPDGWFPVRDGKPFVLETHTQPSSGPAVLRPPFPQPPLPDASKRSATHALDQFEFSPDFLAAIARALAQGSATSSQPPLPTSSQSLLPSKKFFSKTITNATCDLPASVIKELKAGFKSYIPLALCTHKACLAATRTPDAFDTEIGLSDKGEVRLKTKSMSAAKDHHIMTDDFTEIWENFIRGMRRYLVMGDDEAPGGECAFACVDMFRDFFSIIAARPDYTQDWSTYRGYIIESYTSWVGRRDDTYGLIFDEQLFYKHKMTHFMPTILAQLRQPPTGIQAGTSAIGRGGMGARGRGRGAGFSARGGATPQSFPTPYRCYLCNGNHGHKDHQGPAT